MEKFRCGECGKIFTYLELIDMVSYYEIRYKACPKCGSSDLQRGKKKEKKRGKDQKDRKIGG